MTSTSKRVSVAALLACVLVVAGAGAWWFLHDDAPPEVDLDTAAKGVTTTSTATGDAGASSTTGGAASQSAALDGTWKVDTTSGAFDFESATGTFVGYRVQEQLARIGSNTAVGRTNAVTGSMTIEGSTVTGAEFTVDLTKLKSNDSTGFRDGRVQQALDTSAHPTATFKLTAPIQLGASAADGSEVKVEATGDLTVHGVTKSVSFPLQAKLVDGTAVVVGSIDVPFSDFGVQVPSAPVVVSVDDHGTLELQLLLTKG